MVKGSGLTGPGPWGLADWRGAEACGMPGGAVKCVEIRRNTSGEGGSLGST